MINDNFVTGNGRNLKKIDGHPYIGRIAVNSNVKATKIIDELNLHRDNSRGYNVEVEYYFEVDNGGNPMDGLKYAAKMVLEHGTIKSWHNETDAEISKPAGYDDNMSWAVDVKLLGYNKHEGMEAGLVTIAYPVKFFDKASNGQFPLAQLMMAIATEPHTAFSFYRGARITDVWLIYYGRHVWKARPFLQWETAGIVIPQAI